MNYSQPITVSFDESDPGNFLFFGRSFNHAHRVIENFVRECGIGWDTWFNNDEWAVPIRHAESDFKKPMMAGGIYQAELGIEKIGDSSVQFKVKFIEDRDELATVITTHVFINKKSQLKINVPEKIREKLIEFKDS